MPESKIEDPEVRKSYLAPRLGIHIKKVGSYKHLFHCRNSGIAWVEDGSTGLSHSAHPNISATGSIRGMRMNGSWGKNDRVVQSHGFYYNISECVGFGELDAIARFYCLCGGNHGEPKPAPVQEVSS